MLHTPGICMLETAKFSLWYRALEQIPSVPVLVRTIYFPPLTPTQLPVPVPSAPAALRI